jgi:hypothetical protein
VAEDLVDRRVVSPPLTRISLEEVPSAMERTGHHHSGGKTVIVL